MTDDDRDGAPDDYFVQRPPTPPEPAPEDPYGAPPPEDPYAADIYGAPPPPPPPPTEPPGYGQHPIWGRRSPWPRARQQPAHVVVGEFILGAVACVGLNILGFMLLVRTNTVASEISPFIVVVLNFVAIFVPAIKGHKSFSAGFMAGYGLIVVLGVLACFAFVANLTQ